MATTPPLKRVKLTMDFNETKVVLVGSRNRSFKAHTAILKQCTFFQHAIKPEWTKPGDPISLSTADPATFKILLHTLYQRPPKLVTPTRPSKGADPERIDAYTTPLLDLYCLAYFLGHEGICGLVVAELKAVEKATDWTIDTREIARVMKSVPTSCSLVQFMVHQFGTLDGAGFERVWGTIPLEFLRLVMVYVAEGWRGGEVWKRTWEDEVRNKDGGGDEEMDG